MLRAHLSKRVVDSATAPPKGSAWIQDDVLHQFHLRVWRARGGLTKAYVIRYRGGRRWFVIGHHGKPYTPDPQTGAARDLTAELARSEASRLLGVALDGRDPADARKAQRGIPTLADFWPRYLKDHAVPYLAKRSVIEDRRLFELRIEPVLGKRTLDEIGPSVVTQLHAGLKSTPTAANRVLSLLSHVFTIAKRWEVLPKTHPNPCEDLTRFPEVKRERYLEMEEITRVGAALLAEEATGNAYGVAALRLLMFTGARPSEILTLKREWVRLDRGVVMIDSKTGRRPLFLNPPALEVLAAVPERIGNVWLFPSTRTSNHLTLDSLEYVWKRVRAAANVPDVRLYDLRHTFASVAVAGGKTLEMIGGLLGHTKPSTTKRYAHLGARSLRQAGAEVAGEISAALKG